MLVAFNISNASVPPVERAAPAVKPRINAFSLVDDAGLNRATESSRLLQYLLPQVEQTQTELDTLISFSQGFPNVRLELNPLRPEVVKRVLQGLMAANIDATWLSMPPKLLADPLGNEMRQIYQPAIRQLALAHVQAAHYRGFQHLQVWVCAPDLRDGPDAPDNTTGRAPPGDAERPRQPSQIR